MKIPSISHLIDDRILCDLLVYRYEADHPKPRPCIPIVRTNAGVLAAYANIGCGNLGA